MSGYVNTQVNSTSSLILQGSGKLKVNNVDVGGYEGGVRITWEQTEMFVESDWQMGAIDSEIGKVKFRVETSLEEATLENIALAWGINTSSVLSGTSSKVLALSPQTSMQEVALVFEGMSGTNRSKLRTFTCSKAVRIGSSQTTLNRGVKTTVPVQFECLMTSGSFGTVIDSTVTA